MNYNMSGMVINTLVSFHCNEGFKLIGPSQRVCLSSGHWTEKKNPTCEGKDQQFVVVVVVVYEIQRHSLT